MEGDLDFKAHFAHPNISTHALTWRATVSHLANIPSTQVFLPTPSHGGRQSKLKGLADEAGFLPTPSHGGRRGRSHDSSGSRNFYPRPHMEGDIRIRQSVQHRPISTHALTWRATRALFGRQLGAGHFYPRPHMEGDRIPLHNLSAGIQFLPTPSHGGRPLVLPTTWTTFRISTHALTWRATPIRDWVESEIENFYPRPHMEGDTFNLSISLIACYFYPRPHMEGDQRNFVRAAQEKQFLPTPSHGGRHR